MTKQGNQRIPQHFGLFQQLTKGGEMNCRKDLQKEPQDRNY
jgi:hypothetical protein